MRNKFTVGVWSDSQSDTAVVRSMITLISERTEDERVYSDSAKVDLLLVGRRTEGVPDAESRFGSVQACLAETEDATPCPDALTVVRPLRFMPFMDLLQEASKRMANLQPAATEPMEIDAGPGLGHLELASALQDLRLNAPSAIVALVSKSGKSLALLNFQSMAMTTAYKLPTLMRLLHTRVSRIDERNAAAWLLSCEQTRKIPLGTFFWNLGRDMGIYHGLAPWLGIDDVVHLHGWPDFGEIKATQDEIKLCALLSRGSLTPRQLTKQSKVDSVQVSGFLNSASLCDLLVPELMEQPSAPRLIISPLDPLGVGLLRSDNGAAPASPANHPEVVTPVPAAAPPAHLTTQPLAAAEAAGIDASDTSLIFKLKRWPPLETLEKDAGRIRIATILSRKSISLKELVTLSRVDANQCEAFLRMLAQFRLIAIDKQPADLSATQPVAAPRNNSSIDKLGMKGAASLIKSIRRRFGLF